MFEVHVFVCTSGKICPGQGGQEVQAELKRLMKQEGLSQRMRINNSGCLGQCGKGPNIVVYPEGVWYRGVQMQDVPELWEAIKAGRRMERLLNEAHHPDAAPDT